MTKDAQHIVDNGELDLYAFGLLDEPRRSEVERVLTTDADLRSALKDLQSDLESYAALHADEPSADMRSRSLNAAFAADAPRDYAEVDVVNRRPSSQVPDQGSVLHLHARRYLRYAVAASVACVFSSGAAVYYWQQTRSAEQQLEESKREVAALRSTQSVMAARLDMHDTYLSMLSDHDVHVVQLQATPTAPAGTASVVLWNQQSHEVYVQTQRLPQHSPSTDYQLWALVNGKPIDLGVIHSTDTMPLAQMKSVEHADAFAITLEPKGGSPTPTLSQLYTMGKTSS